MTLADEIINLLKSCPEESEFMADDKLSAIFHVSVDEIRGAVHGSNCLTLEPGNNFETMYVCYWPEEDPTPRRPCEVLCLSCKNCRVICTKVSYDPFHESLTGIGCLACSGPEFVYPATSCGDYEAQKLGDTAPVFAVSGLREAEK